MNTVRELHEQAMKFANEALISRNSGDSSSAVALARRGLPLEIEAANRIPKTPDSEPTRSILYRSASSLAYQAQDFELAQRLAFEGLSGHPPPTVEQELKDLYEQINFSSHLRVRGSELETAQFQFSLVGDDVGSGQVAYSALNRRLQSLMNLIDRTSRRINRQVYKRRKDDSEAASPFVPLIGAARSGSFAITVELSQRKNAPIPMFSNGDQVIDEVITGISLIQGGQEDQLEERINDESYYVNFIYLCKQLAPDGDRVKMVGLTSLSNEVSFTLTSPEIPTPLSSKVDGDRGPILRALEGVLDEASARDGAIGLTTPDGTTITLKVIEGMDDMVRSNFNRSIRALISSRGTNNTLLEIFESE